MVESLDESVIDRDESDAKQSAANLIQISASADSEAISDQNEDADKNSRSVAANPESDRKREMKRAKLEAGQKFGPWMQYEQDRFIEAVSLYGKDRRKVSVYIGSRDCKQVQHLCKKLVQKFHEDPSAKGSYLLPILE